MPATSHKAAWKTWYRTRQWHPRRKAKGMPSPLPAEKHNRDLAPPPNQDNADIATCPQARRVLRCTTPSRWPSRTTHRHPRRKARGCQAPCPRRKHHREVAPPPNHDNADIVMAHTFNLIRVSRAGGDQCQSARRGLRCTTPSRWPSRTPRRNTRTARSNRPSQPGTAPGPTAGCSHRGRCSPRGPNHHIAQVIVALRCLLNVETHRHDVELPPTASGGANCLM